MVFINQLLIDFPIQTSYLQSPFSIGRDHTPRQKKEQLYIQYVYTYNMDTQINGVII